MSSTQCDLGAFTAVTQEFQRKRDRSILLTAARIGPILPKCPASLAMLRPVLFTTCSIAGVGRMRLFSKTADYERFEAVLADTLKKIPLAICGYCLMPNHWHFVVWPTAAGELGRFFQRLTVTHATRWQRHRRRVGYGHVYQGRFKSFPVEEDEHFYQLVRYVERNAAAGKPCRRCTGLALVELLDSRSWHSDQRAMLANWPVPRPRNWLELVRRPQSEAELAALRHSVMRGNPLRRRSLDRRKQLAGSA